jgi:hypothetical protein
MICSLLQRDDVTRFLLQVFLWISFPSSHLLHHQGHLEFILKSVYVDFHSSRCTTGVNYNGDNWKKTTFNSYFVRHYKACHLKWSTGDDLYGCLVNHRCCWLRQQLAAGITTNKVRVNPGEDFNSGVSDTNSKFATVSTTLVVNLLPVSLILACTLSSQIFEKWCLWYNQGPGERWSTKKSEVKSPVNVPFRVLSIKV